MNLFGKQPDIDQRIGKNIQRVRKEQRITQEELANSIGAIKQTVSKIERGVYSPTFKVLIDICNALSTTPNELLLNDTEWLEWREENILRTHTSLNGLRERIDMIENFWARADFCKETGDKHGEEVTLDQIIQIYGGSNNDFLRELAEFLYQKDLQKYLKQAVTEVRKNKVNNLKIKELKK